MAKEDQDLNVLFGVGEQEARSRTPIPGATRSFCRKPLSSRYHQRGLTCLGAWRGLTEESGSIGEEALWRTTYCAGAPGIPLLLRPTLATTHRKKLASSGQALMAAEEQGVLVGCGAGWLEALWRTAYPSATQVNRLMPLPGAPP